MSVLERDAHAHPETLLLSPDASPDPRADEETAGVDQNDNGDDDNLPLVELLLQASDTIRAERQRADALEEENRTLRGQLDAVRAAFHSAAAQRVRLLPEQEKSVAAWVKVDPLHAYVQSHLIPSTAPAPPRNTAVEAPGSNSSGRSPKTSPRRRSPSGVAASAASSSSAARARSRGSVTAATQSYHKGWEAAATTSPRGGATATPPAREASTRCRRSTAPATSTATAASERRTSPPESRTPSAPRESAEARLGGPTSSVQAMACRLRRALAPRPAEAVRGDIIHTMVSALQADVQEKLEAARASSPSPPPRLRGFAMVRLRPCVYQLLVGPPAEVKASAKLPTMARAQSATAATPAAAPYRHDYLLYRSSQDGIGAPAQPPRVQTIIVHLAIDSGALRVVRGGGHVDFVEYLERLLHIKL